MKTPQPVRRVAACAAVILAALALATPPAQAGGGAATDTNVVRGPQADECHYADV
ncbi:hypothetical protein ACFLIM_09955 [Nonomuraea sp. M3C6]|uniref:Uncharacterized protein n=1 Tax=Nonomuraea marmarensis TaxID=3351344 RepID=A0ABW7A856_9ACTN